MVILYIFQQKDTLLVVPGSGGDTIEVSKGGAALEQQMMLGSAAGLYGQNTLQRGSMYQSGLQGYTTNMSMFEQQGGGFYGNTLSNKYSDMSMLDTWRTNQLYLDDVSGAADFVAHMPTYR